MKDRDNCFRHVFNHYNILIMIFEKSKDKNIDTENPTKIQKNE